MKINNLVVLLFVSLVFVMAGCKKKYNDDDFHVLCPPFENLDPIELTESALESFAFPDNFERIVFSDASGTEFPFAKLFERTDNVSFFLNGPFPCSLDSTQTVSLKGTTIDKSLTLINFDKEISVFVNLRTDILLPGFGVEEVQARDVLLISVTHNVVANLNLVLDPRNSINHPLTEPTLDSFDIHGHTYYNVFHVPGLPSSSVNIYYTKAEGIVALKSGDNSISLKFERFE